MIQECILTSLRRISHGYDNLLPSWLKNRVSPVLAIITNLMYFASKKIKKNDLILDAGAGNCQYKSYFTHAVYESCDIKQSAVTHTFLCDLEKIPRKDETYDAIINTQVLEHVRHPQQVLQEFHRILKPNGKLFLSAPQEGGMHEIPNHYHNFTKYGLQSELEEAGFIIKFIKPMGGAFLCLAGIFYQLPNYLMYQYATKDDTKYAKPFEFAPKPLFILILPFYLLLKPFTELIIPFLCYYLDKLDFRNYITAGYVCYCVKK